MNKQILKKWWFWLVIVLALGGIGAATQTSTQSNSTEQASTENDTSVSESLPTLIEDDYEDKEGLVAYKELQAKGYTVSAEFENQALTDINGKASDIFEPLDPSDAADRQSVDAFIVSSVSQDGKAVLLNIKLASN